MIFNIQMVALAALLLLIAIPAYLWLRRTPASSTFRRPLFTPSKRSFFGQLNMALNSHCVVFPGIPVNRLIRAKTFSRSASMLDKLKEASFDYVICDRKNMDIKCVIVLNSSSDLISKKIDSLVKLCNHARIPLLQYEEKPYRNVPALRREIFTSCGIEEPQSSESYKPQRIMRVSYNTKTKENT